jgi:hypothetical protein
MFAFSLSSHSTPTPLTPQTINRRATQRTFKFLLKAGNWIDRVDLWVSTKSVNFVPLLHYASHPADI